jgi:hypothetical protein
VIASEKLDHLELAHQNTCPKLEWAMIAVSGYIREDGPPRVVVPLMVSEAYVLDGY